MQCTHLVSVYFLGITAHTLKCLAISHQNVLKTLRSYCWSHQSVDVL